MSLGVIEAAVHLTYRVTQTLRHLIFEVFGKAAGSKIDKHQGRLAVLQATLGAMPALLPARGVKARHHILGLLERLLVRSLGVFNVPNHQFGNDFSGKVQCQAIKVAMVSHVARSKDGSRLMLTACHATRPRAHGNECLAQTL